MGNVEHGPSSGHRFEPCQLDYEGDRSSPGSYSLTGQKDG